MEGNIVEFVNGKTKWFDAIVLATVFRSTVRKWLRVCNLVHASLTHIKLTYIIYHVIITLVLILFNIKRSTVKNFEITYPIMP